MQIGCGNFPYLNFRPLSMTTWQQVPTFKWMVQHGAKVGACAKGLKWFLACGILLEMRQHRQIRPNTIAYDSDPWPPKQESWMCNNYIIIYLYMYTYGYLIYVWKLGRLWHNFHRALRQLGSSQTCLAHNYLIIIYTHRCA